MDDNNDFEIGDVENYISEKDQAYNHGILVMASSRKVIDAGSKELRPGWWNKKLDRNGLMQEIYHEDTRKAYISSVKQLKAIMNCDFDEEAKRVIAQLLKDIEDKKQEYVNIEKTSWEKLDWNEKNRKRYIPTLLTDEVLRDALTDFQLDKYIEIFCELNNLAKRLDFYKAESIDG